MYLQKLHIEKFRKVENVDFEFKNGINALGGKNGIGKTTINDSVMWLLCDETLVCDKENKTNLDDNDIKKKLLVEGTFILNDGTEFVLKREYTPVYRNDGSFSDYKNQFYINGANYTVTDYLKTIKNIIGLKDINVKQFNALRSVIDFNYFGKIDYKIAREAIEVLLQLGNDTDLINQEKYRIIKQEVIAQNFDLTKAKSMVNSQKKVYENDVNNITAELNILKGNLKPFDEKRYNELLEKKNKLEKLNFEHTPEYITAQNKIAEIDKKIQSKQEEYKQARFDYETKKTKNDNVSNPLKEYEKEMDELRGKFVSIKNSIAKCPKCNYELNGETVRQQLSQIKTDGIELNKKIENLKKLQQEINLDNEVENVKKLRAELEQLLADKNELQSSFNSIIASEETQSRAFYQQRQSDINDVMAELAKIKEESNNARVEVLTENIDKLNEKLATCDVKVDLIADFEKEKIMKIAQKVNDVFPNKTFILNEISEKGTEKKTCKATYNNVDYLRLNDGQKIKLGIEIIEDLKRAYGMTEDLPIIFDKFRDLDNENMLALKQLTNSQILTTYVSKDNNIIINNL